MKLVFYYLLLSYSDLYKIDEFLIFVVSDIEIFWGLASMFYLGFIFGVLVTKFCIIKEISYIVCLIYK